MRGIFVEATTGMSDSSSTSSIPARVPFATTQAPALLSAIVQNSDDAILSKKLDGTITSWNRAAERIFGYTEEEMIGNSILVLIPTALHSEEREIIERIRSGQRVDHFETVRLRKDGTQIEVAITISPILDENGVVIGASKIARDISSRRQMEKVLLQSEKLAATGRMAATIAHEINNPLESVMNLIYLARVATDPASEIQGYLETAEREIERVSHIARQTLGFYRDKGLPALFSLQLLLENTLRVYQRKMEERGIHVHASYPEDSTMLGRRGELAQVFANIIANSIDAMPNGGDLYLQVQPVLTESGKVFHISMRDNGSGIQKADLQRVFEPFFTTKGDLGTGIGLWVAKQLLEGHKGTIGVYGSTDAQHHGVTISIMLPA